MWYESMNSFGRFVAYGFMSARQWSFHCENVLCRGESKPVKDSDGFNVLTGPSANGFEKKPETRINLKEYTLKVYARVEVLVPKQDELQRHMTARYGYDWRTNARLPSWLHRWHAKPTWEKADYDASSGREVMRRNRKDVDRFGDNPNNKVKKRAEFFKKVKQ